MYGIPVRRLQREISSREFTELQAFKNRNTLYPAVVKMLAEQTSWIIAGSCGEAVHPRELMPGYRYDAEAKRKAKEEAAERSLDRLAGEGE